VPLPARALLALTALVALVHLWAAAWGLPPRLGEGAGDGRPARIAVDFVRTLAPADRRRLGPAPVPAPPLRRLPAAAPQPPAGAASAAAAAAADEAAGPLAALQPVPAPAELPGLPPPDALPDALPPLAGAASAAAPAASAALVAGTDAATAADPAADPAAVVSAAEAAQAAASAPAGAPRIDWPPSTRISYQLTGDYRGPVEGQAQVEWLREGNRYQVHMDLSVGPFFAPLMARRASSSGEITPAGLRPARYDEETRMALRPPRRLAVLMDADQVLLPAGGREPRPAGLQDSASQFVQLTWLFNTQPALLSAGTRIRLPVALPRRVFTWVYEVMQPEALHTPAGTIEAVHIRPEVPPQLGSDLLVELWVAPSLQYLPVRILVRQSADTYVDLLIKELPLQAAGAAEGAGGVMGRPIVPPTIPVDPSR
jgi:hypothetical protein